MSVDEHLCTKTVYQRRKKQVWNVNLSHLFYAIIPLHGLDTSMTYEEAGDSEGVNCDYLLILCLSEKKVWLLLEAN